MTKKTISENLIAEAHVFEGGIALGVYHKGSNVSHTVACIETQESHPVLTVFDKNLQRYQIKKRSENKGAVLVATLVEMMRGVAVRGQAFVSDDGDSLAAKINDYLYAEANGNIPGLLWDFGDLKTVCKETPWQLTEPFIISIDGEEELGHELLLFVNECQEPI